MLWQDIVIAVVSLLFGFILIPQLKDMWRDKSILNVYTAGLTTIGLFILAITFFTLNLWISVFAETFSAIIWLLIFILSFKNKKKKSDI
jgi:CHASE2 domain-containing sensor protein